MGKRNLPFAALAAGLALLAAPGAPLQAAKAPVGPAAAAKPDPTPTATSIDALFDHPAPAAAPPEPAPEPQPPPPAADSDAAAIPPGAPDDDYGLVAWCEGALAGHMALFPVVKPELDRMEQSGDKAKDAEMDAEQQAAGREYLELYVRARRAAEARGDGAPARAEGLRRSGVALWAPVRAADANARMWSWVMWELPARCETAARRLESGTSASSDVLHRHSSDDAPPQTQTPTQTQTQAAPQSPPQTGDSPARR